MLALRRMKGHVAGGEKKSSSASDTCQTFSGALNSVLYHFRIASDSVSLRIPNLKPLSSNSTQIFTR
ncbi:hypothetical protein Bca101_038555 [Brassica carinata]